MKKRVVFVLTRVIFFSLLSIGVCVSLPSCSHIFKERLVLLNFGAIVDKNSSPYREIAKAFPPFHFTRDRAMERRYADAFNSIVPPYDGLPEGPKFDAFLGSSGTTAFLVVKDDVILYEKYFNGHSRDTPGKTLSMSKSFASALVGIAVDEGLIHSVDQPMTDYIPELKGMGLDGVTIKHLLMMTSGLKFRTGFLPWDEFAKCFKDPFLRKLVTTNLAVEEPPGEHFRYHEYHSALLAIILERATRRTVSNYLQEKIWKPLGMEFPAAWSIDSREDGLESMAAGLNARAIDVAKLGRLYLNKGLWNGKRIISEKWVKESTAPDAQVPGDYYPEWFKKRNIYYKYLWWGHSLGNGDYNFYGFGFLGQVLYVCPGKRVIIVRFGKSSDLWDDIARKISESIE